MSYILFRLEREKRLTNVIAGNGIAYFSISAVQRSIKLAPPTGKEIERERIKRYMRGGGIRKVVERAVRG